MAGLYPFHIRKHHLATDRVTPAQRRPPQRWPHRQNNRCYRAIAVARCFQSLDRFDFMNKASERMLAGDAAVVLPAGRIGPDEALMTL